VIPVERSTGSGHVSKLGDRPALDGVRALAVLAVLAYHLELTWARGGFLGVDLFMVLSGFLITSLLLLERDSTGRVSLAGFWARRVRRIVPAVLLVLLAVSVHAAWFASPIELTGLRWDALASLTFWANWRFVISGSGYWADFSGPSPLTHFWSLAVEEQFYLVWPLVVIGVFALPIRRRVSTSARVTAVSVVGIIGSVAAMVALYDPASPSRAYLGTDTRVHTLLVGALGAALLRPAAGRPLPHAGVLQRLGALALVPVVVALVFVHDRSAWLYHGGFLVFAVGAMLVVAAATATDGPVAQLFDRASLRWIGRRSFGLYLWHWPAIVILTPDRTGLDGVVLDLTVVTVTFAAASFSFRWVEEPIRRRGRSGAVANRRLATTTVGAITVTGAVIVATTVVPVSPTTVLDAGDLLPTPTTVPVVTTTGPPTTTTASTSATVTTATTTTTTTSTTSSVPPRRTVERVLLQGDSVALFAALPAAEAFAAAGVDVVNRTFAGLSLAKPAVADAIATSDADVSVWMLSLWDVGDEETQRQRYREFVDRSFDEGMDVVFVDRPPVLDELETEERLRLRAIVDELAADDPRITVLDPVTVWGDTVELDRDGDGVPERWRDLVHVCPQGSARWTAWLLDELAARFDGIAPADPSTWINGDWVRHPLWADNPGQCDPV
jgi:peptidoglycan/LPS O-acetylase OafA/YrhL